MILGVDVGGTFTDLALWDGDALHTTKVPTSARQEMGVVAGAGAVARDRAVARMLHGTTVATNALLERTGARTALIATDGFGDVIEIGRQDRPSLYDALADRPEPLVPPDLRFSIPERIGPGGRELVALTGEEDLIAAVLAARPEAVAIALLHSYAAGRHEEMVAAKLRRAAPGLPVSVSSAVSAEFREFERTSTTVLNAYLAPVTGHYLADLVEAVTAAGLTTDVAVMRSSGGLMPASQAAALPSALLLSGPAGGVVAAAELGRALGHEHLVSFDMGGTSTDVCRIDGGTPELAYERAVEGYPCRMPAVAVHTVGAGGGSVGWADRGGALRVGPRSAGARPGPACYGLGGTEPAVTDADVVLGRIGASRLGGAVHVDRQAAANALAALGERLGLDAARVAAGMVAVVEEHMAGAVRRVSVEEGADPRRAVLVAFGGAGGMHATALARKLGMAGVVVPPHAGVFSALGLLLSPPRADAARSVLLGADRVDALDRAVGEVLKAAEAALRGTGAVPRSVTASVDARYRGQSHETPVDYAPGDGWPALEARLHAAHRSRNGFDRAGDPVEAVTVRAVAIDAPALHWRDLVAAPARDDSRPLRRTGDGGTAVWWRPAAVPGTEITGPAVVEDAGSTTYLAAGERAVVHESGALEIDW